MSLPDSVDAFLAQVREGKAKDTASLREKAQELAADPGISLLHPDLHQPTAALMRQYGDAPLRSSAIAMIGMWLRFHQDSMAACDGDTTALFMLARDMERLNIVLHILGGVGTLRPIDEWKKAMEETLFARFLAECEEDVIEPNDFQPEVFEP